MTGLVPGTAGWGNYAPASKITGGGYDIGWYAGGTTLSKVDSTVATPSGEYLTLHGTANAVVGAAAPDSFLTPNQADRIDTKIDDGLPNTGTVVSASFLAVAATSCTTTGAAASIYNESLPGALCSLYIQFQN